MFLPDVSKTQDSPGPNDENHEQKVHISIQEEERVQDPELNIEDKFSNNKVTNKDNIHDVMDDQTTIKNRKSQMISQKDVKKLDEDHTTTKQGEFQEERNGGEKKYGGNNLAVKAYGKVGEEWALETDSEKKLYPKIDIGKAMIEMTPRNPNEPIKDEKVAPMEHLAVKAYGDPGEKWKVLGYSEKTGYPIIDLSELGIKPKTSVAETNQQKSTKNVDKQTQLKDTKNQNDPKPRPLSYSEMKGGNKVKYVPSKIPIVVKKKPGIDEVTKRLHAKLHRTYFSGHETLRSILYPQLNVPKYRISSKKRKILDKLHYLKRPEPKGKYDFRQLDVEKLHDIIITDGAILIFRYLRDLPSVPIIYECKMQPLGTLSKILSDFLVIDKFFGSNIIIRGKSIRRRWLSALLQRLLRWVLRITTLRDTLENSARTLEYDLIMFEMEMPQWLGSDCEGEMDQMDWDTFNFHYNFIMNLGEQSSVRKVSKRKMIKDSIKKNVDRLFVTKIDEI